MELVPCQQELLKTGHFQQGARKYIKNFIKKTESWVVPALLTKDESIEHF